jgi:hypothetical protein
MAAQASTMEVAFHNGERTDHPSEIARRFQERFGQSSLELQ